MFTYTKITLAIFLTLIITGVAYIVGIIDQRYSDYVFFIGLVVQTIILTIIIIKILIGKNKLKRGVKIIRYKIIDKHIKGGTYIIPEYITPINPIRPSIFKIFIEADDFKESPDFTVCKVGKGNYNIGADKCILDIKKGIVEKSFIFDADIIVGPNEKINCKFKDDINIKTFFVGELYLP